MAHSERFIKLVDSAKSRISEINPQQLAERQKRGDKLLLIDTREESEWARGHIPGAVHLGKGIIERDVEGIAPDLDTDIVLYCGGGFRSALAADALQNMGYTRVASMADGWRGWNDLGLPVE